MNKILVATLMLSFLNIGAALAQTGDPTRDSLSQKSAQPQVRYKQVTSYEFDNDQVEGTTLRPDGEIVNGIKKGRPTSLVKARQHFTPEMLKSVEDF